MLQAKFQQLLTQLTYRNNHNQLYINRFIKVSKRFQRRTIFDNYSNQIFNPINDIAKTLSSQKNEIFDLQSLLSPHRKCKYEYDKIEQKKNNLEFKQLSDVNLDKISNLKYITNLVRQIPRVLPRLDKKIKHHSCHRVPLPLKKLILFDENNETYQFIKKSPMNTSKKILIPFSHPLELKLKYVQKA